MAASCLAHSSNPRSTGESNLEKYPSGLVSYPTFCRRTTAIDSVPAYACTAISPSGCGVASTGAEERSLFTTEKASSCASDQPSIEGSSPRKSS
ncbi:hypothetical protein XELAEV_18002066mg [Xenopus laevis]|nr:hypothetical protein XELAEV_18002066mg [Xenopus laevis]